LGDNSPYYVHANLVLEQLVGCKLEGYTNGGRILDFGKSEQTGHFDENHVIFAGINHLHEGVTICYPDKPSKLKVLATSTDGKPCILNCERGQSNFSNGGRIVIDSGWTKLYRDFWADAGQSRYVVNASVWLTDVETRFGCNLSAMTKEVTRN